MTKRRREPVAPTATATGPRRHDRWPPKARSSGSHDYEYSPVLQKMSCPRHRRSQASNRASCSPWPNATRTKFNEHSCVASLAASRTADRRLSTCPMPWLPARPRVSVDHGTELDVAGGDGILAEAGPSARVLVRSRPYSRYSAISAAAPTSVLLPLARQAIPAHPRRNRPRPLLRCRSGVPVPDAREPTADDGDRPSRCPPVRSVHRNAMT